MASGIGKKSSGRWLAISLALLMLLSLHFVLRSLGFGLGGLSGRLEDETHLFMTGADFSNATIFGHMVTGALLTFLAPVQLFTGLRQRWPKLHRLSGYALFCVALLTSIAGELYILLRGTIGGPLMNAGFAFYGGLLFIAAIQTVRHARRRNFRIHRQWALRLFVLAVGSWLYRVHYTLWYIATGGLGSYTDFTGPFDQVQVFAFYLPYLIALEIWFRAKAFRSAPTH